jgi:hypothetical protein
MSSNCPCPIISKPLKTNSGDNNTQITQKIMQSIIIKNATYRNGKRINYISTDVNAYGRATGSPHGYGRPPKNSF